MGKAGHWTTPFSERLWRTVRYEHAQADLNSALGSGQHDAQVGPQGPSPVQARVSST